MDKKDQPTETILRHYLEDAIAAERNFETQLRGMAKQGDQQAPQQLFQQHAEETQRQHERLTTRLHELGGSPSVVKTFMAHVFNFAPKTAQMGHDGSEVSTQNLIIAFAVENSEIAMYEALATVAAAAGDLQTEQLAREIQEEERTAAQRVWNMIATSAQHSFSKIHYAA